MTISSLEFKIDKLKHGFIYTIHARFEESKSG